MLSSQFSLYLGKENTKGYTDFVAEEMFYCILEIEEGFSKEDGKNLIAALKEKSRRPVENLFAFEFLISDTLKQANVPANFSLAAFLIKGDMLYMKSAGAGQIFLAREGEFARIIDGDNSAAGHMKSGDFFILTTSRFTQLIGDEKHLKSVFTSEAIEKNIEEFNKEFEDKDDHGMIALFLSFKDSSGAHVPIPPPLAVKTSEPPASKVAIFSFIKRMQEKVRSLSDGARQSPLKRAITFTAVGIIFLILIWSVVLGYQRRSQTELYKKINFSTEIINHKLSQAQDVSSISLPNAVALIAQAKEELANLKKSVGDKKIKEIQALEQSIKDKEQLITKKEEKKYEEFFDLTVDDKSAQGDAMALGGDDAVILDKNRGVIYILSLIKKSLDTRSASGVKKATLVGIDAGSPTIFIPGSGFYAFDDNNKTKNVIPSDADWGTITDFKIFNSNLYLLDSSKNDVYKYVSGADGYGGKNSYFKGSTVNLKESNSLAIDASVYIGFSDGVLKFTSGLADTFKTSFPEEGISITKIFTSEDVDHVYAWDKSKSALYILSKDGAYERQIKSSIFSQAKDVVVYGQSAYVLAGSKIYTISVK